MADEGTPIRGARKARARQKDLPGAEVHEIPELNKEMHDYREIRDERMKLTSRESESKQRIHMIMVKHQVRTYRAAGLVAEIEAEPEFSIHNDKTAVPDDAVEV